MAAPGVMQRIRAHANSGVRADVSTVASGYVSAVGELIPFPSQNTLPVSGDVISTGRGGIVLLLGLTAGLAAFAYIARAHVE